MVRELLPSPGEKGVRNVGTAACAAIILVAVVALTAQQPAAPLFKSGVSRVALAAIVRDGKGKLVTDLTAHDFELLDSGRRTPLIGVWSEASPASVAVLMDVSGSMATKMERARETSRYLLGGLQPGIDEAALFSFDTELKELRPFSSTFETADQALASTSAYGATSLWDAIAETADRISTRQRRRALVVVTDGVDSASRLKPARVSAIASSLDVPVYIVVVTYSMEDESHDPTPVHGQLADLAAWTGGELLIVRDTPSAVTAMRQIVTELQHQYVVAFEPGTAPGWHALVLRTKRNGLFVRARNGYMVGAQGKL
jgi:Ca-activated chloride channel family protein